MPGRLAFVLYVVQTLLGYGRHLSDTITTTAEKPQFPTVAAVFGTHNLSRIAAHLQRGILRAIALERYLLARAEQDREIAVKTPPNLPRVMLAEEWEAEWAAQEAAAEAARAAEAERAAELAKAAGSVQFVELPPPAKPARTTTPRKPRIDPDDPYTFYMPTLEELEREVRRQPIGRTIIAICTDLGLVPGFCGGNFWNEVYDAFRWHDGSLNAIWDVWKRREESFKKERDRRPETWDYDWRAYPKDKVRQIVGCLIGEPPPTLAPLLATAPP